MLMAISLGAGCVGDEAVEVEGAVEATVKPPGAVLEPLAVIEDATGRVEWLPPQRKGDDPEIVITVRGTAAPLIHPDQVEKIGTVQSYLALVDENAPVPAALAAFARHEDDEIAADPVRRRALRSETLAAREAFEATVATWPKGEQRLADACTTTQKNHARDTYGAAYSAGGGSSGSKTCGQTLNFHSATGTTYYCNIENSDCDLRLGGGVLGVGGECDPNACTTVRGATQAFRLRWPSTPAAIGGGVSHYGVRYRFGYKNCSLQYSAVMRRKRGSGDWVYTTIEPNAMQIRVGGDGYPPEYALVRDVVAWGLWEEHWNWGTSSNPLNTMEMTAPTEGLMCGDIIQRFDTYDETHLSCNGGESLCDDNSCSGNLAETGCWD